DGRARPLDLRLPPGAGPLTLTGLDLTVSQPVDRAAEHRLTVSRIEAVGDGGTTRALTLPTTWTAVSSGGDQDSFPDHRNAPAAAKVTSARPLTVTYGTGYVPRENSYDLGTVSVRLQVGQPARTEIAAVATDRFLASAGARTGQRMDVTFAGRNLPVRIVRAVHELPTTSGAGQSAAPDAAHDGGGILMDLRSVNRLLQSGYGESAEPTEWWLRTDPAHTADVAAALRALPDVDPAQVVVRAEIADRLRDDP
ncbi:ABC transporter permease, partial [Streptomyces sp. SID625]|nr:ABC transporter permease [Streptomyces sp. SID625]